MRDLVLMILLVIAFIAPVPDLARGQDKPIELKLSHWVSTAHIHHKTVLEPWAKMIDEQSKGRLKIVIYPGGVLGKPADHWDLVKNGIADIGWGTHNYTGGRFPLTSAAD